MHTGRAASAAAASAGAASISVDHSNSAHVKGMSAAFRVAAEATSMYYSNRSAGRVQHRLAVTPDDDSDKS